MLQQNRILRLIGTASGTVLASDRMLNSVDPDGLRYLATVWVWTHWFISVACFVVLVYRPVAGHLSFYAYTFLFALLVGCNGYMHYRLASSRTVTWHWTLAFCGMDMVLATSAVLIGGGFSHYFFYLLYYPALAGFAVTFTSFRLNLVWVTAVSAIYLVICLTFGEGIDVAARDEKPLFIRIVVMYAVTLSVNLVSRFERFRWREAVKREREAVERERALQRDRSALTHTLHDTMAQSAYMIGLGIDTAKEHVEESNRDLSATLEATSQLSKTLIWQLRHPIDMGLIFEGRGLSSTLKSHAATFTAVTSIPVNITQSGKEPPLSIETRSEIFSVAHNALTNAFRHAGASEVLVELDFTNDPLRVSVADNGVGLPEDFGERGHGLANMRESVESLGGELVIEPRGPSGGASISCLIPRGGKN